MSRYKIIMLFKNNYIDSWTNGCFTGIEHRTINLPLSTFRDLGCILVQTIVTPLLLLCTYPANVYILSLYELSLKRQMSVIAALVIDLATYLTHNTCFFNACSLVSDVNVIAE